MLEVGGLSGAAVALSVVGLALTADFCRDPGWSSFVLAMLPAAGLVVAAAVQLHRRWNLVRPPGLAVALLATTLVTVLWVVVLALAWFSETASCPS